MNGFQICERGPVSSTPFPALDDTTGTIGSTDYDWQAHGWGLRRMHELFRMRFFFCKYSLLAGAEFCNFCI